MEITPQSITDPCVLQLFSEHDDYMLDFLGRDRQYYTRYNADEKIEHVWVAYEDGFPAGCIACRRKEAGMDEIKRLFVRPAYRGRGFAKELLKRLERHAKEQNCRSLYLDTRISLEPAVSLYQAFGFRIIFQEGLYIQMEKAL